MRARILSDAVLASVTLTSMSALTDQLDALASEEPDLGSGELLLLWFVRRVLEQEELESYEYVFVEPRQAVGMRVDAAFLAEPEDDSTSQTLNLIEVVQDNQRARLHRRVEDIAQALSRPAGSERADLVRDLVVSLDLSTRKKLDPERTAVRLMVLAPRASGASLVEDREGLELHVYDAEQIEQLARAIAAPSAVHGTIRVDADDSEILETDIRSGTVFVCPVSAAEIVKWPGIEDRTLFDLNVRLKLGGRRVRQSLEAGIRDHDAAADFLAGHNGITVVCDSVDRVTGGLEVRNFSVVNGTQSVIAFYENQDELVPGTRVLAKFAAVGTAHPIAREIAIRSNTQNPVTSRNLRALDLRQLRIADDFETHFPDYVYVIRPGTSVPSGRTAINNDDAAQLLCAIYNQKPWLAVKRQVLFEPPHYQQIFSDRIGAPEILLCHRIMESIRSEKQEFPAEYHRAWKLTSLVASYLAGQILRVNDELMAVLRRPRDFLAQSDTGIFRHLALSAAAVLSDRASLLANEGIDDDYKVDFKRETALRDLASSARRKGLVVIAAGQP